MAAMQLQVQKIGFTYQPLNTHRPTKLGIDEIHHGKVYKNLHSLKRYGILDLII